MDTLTQQFISETLYGYYPNTQYITPQITAEMLKKMDLLDVTPEEFLELLDIHRSDPKISHMIPHASKMLVKLPSIRNGRQNQSSDARLRCGNIPGPTSKPQSPG